MNEAQTSLAAFRCPRWEELPAISLYMDQVVIVLDEAIGPLMDGERPLTSTMVNNYVKHRVIPPPEKKKYQRIHLAALVVVGVMKRVLSMQEITTLIHGMIDESGSEQAAYNDFCTLLEQVLAAAFGNGNEIFDPAEWHKSTHGTLKAALCALCGKLCLRGWMLEYTQAKAPPAGKPPKEKLPKEKASKLDR